MLQEDRYKTLKEAIRREGTGHCGLVAVSKNQSVEKIRRLIELGHRDFGENKLQDALEKWPDLQRQYSDICLHFIGPLQSKKTKEVVRNFDVLHSLDREKLANKLSSVLAETPKHGFRCFVQVNTGQESQKAGVAPSLAGDFIEFCTKDLALPVVGLMCIPPAGDNPRVHFRLLHALAKEKNLEHLSMGMSNDYEIALEEGATYLRVGTYLFGER